MAGHQTRKQFEVLWVGEVFDADPCPDKHTGQGADNHRPGQRPQHPPFPDVPIDPAGYGDDVEDLIGTADRGSRVPEHAHLKRK